MCTELHGGKVGPCSTCWFLLGHKHKDKLTCRCSKMLIIIIFCLKHFLNKLKALIKSTLLYVHNATYGSRDLGEMASPPILGKKVRKKSAVQAIVPNPFLYLKVWIHHYLGMKNQPSSSYLKILLTDHSTFLSALVLRI